MDNFKYFHLTLCCELPPEQNKRHYSQEEQNDR